MRRRDAPSPWPWIGASVAALGALWCARWWIDRAALQGDRSIQLDASAWVTALRPTLDARCGACHREAPRRLRLRARPSAAEVIEELDAVRGLVIPGDVEGSLLRRRALGASHPAALVAGSCEDRALVAWISGRAVSRCDGFTLPRGLTPLGAPRDASALDLSTPSRALETQLALLRAAEWDALRECFLPEVTLALTDRALDACRLAIIGRGVRVSPDWSRAVRGGDGGGEVVRVSVMGDGGATTGFHLRGGRWLADALWCAE